MINYFNIFPKIVSRGQPSITMSYWAPVIAISLTLVTGAVIFSFMGHSPIFALHTFFISPVSSYYGVSELFLKATPLALIGIGLAFCFKNNIYNIGAEGQLTMGAIFGGGIGIFFYDVNGYWLLPLVIIFGAIGGIFWAMIPAILKVKFNTNEILTSLMLVYISALILDYLVIGPWRDPDGYSFPKTRPFNESSRMPLLFPELNLRIHFGLIITIFVTLLAWFIFAKTMLGYQLKVSGLSPKASKFAGFNQNKIVYIAFAICGGLAGIAGVGEVTGPIGLIYRNISPNYGFTAIIVAFLGRLHPVGIIFSSIIIALTYLGAEDAQLFMQVPQAVGFVFQGLVLFYLLGADILINYRIVYNIKFRKKVIW